MKRPDVESPMLVDQEAPLLFRYWSDRSVAPPAPRIFHVDGHRGDLLQAVMAHFTSELDALGAMLTVQPPGVDEPSILFVDAPFEARTGESSVMAIARAMAPVRGDSDDEGAPSDWNSVIVADQPYSTLTLAIVTADRHRFEATAIFSAEADALGRKGERALKAMRPILSAFLASWAAGRRSARHADGLQAALDRSDVGILLLDRGGAPVFANRAARAFLDAGEGIRRSGRSVAAVDLSDALRLQVAIDHIMGRAGDAGGGPLRTPVLTLKRPGRKRALTVSVMSPENASAVDVAAILYIFDPDQDVGPHIRAACKFYQLSPVEINLTCLLVAGQNISEAAAEMRVKVQTARTYLKQIFLKTDTHRQADLVRLMLSNVVHTSSGTDLEVI